MRVPVMIACLGILVAACGSTAVPSAPGSAAAAPSGVSAAGSIAVASGNGVVAPAPSDLPSSIAAKPALPGCGSIVSFAVDPDVSPAPTPPSKITTTAENDAALACLTTSWQAHRQAVLVTDETTDEQDRIYTLYRLPGDGTVDLVVRLDSHTEGTVTWTETTCRDLTILDARPTPVNCDTEQQIR